MNDLAASIRALDDATAERLLATVAKHRLRAPAGTPATPTPELTEALAQAVGPAPAAAAPTRGELARATLLLLAEDPARQKELEALIRHPPPEVYAADPVTLAILGTAAVVVLQSYIKVEYDQKQGIRVKIEKQPLDKSLLGQVIGLLKGLFTRA
jgi:hypothetical protein